MLKVSITLDKRTAAMLDAERAHDGLTRSQKVTSLIHFSKRIEEIVTAARNEQDRDANAYERELERAAYEATVLRSQIRDLEQRLNTKGGTTMDIDKLTEQQQLLKDVIVPKTDAEWLETLPHEIRIKRPDPPETIPLEQNRRAWRIFGRKSR